MHTDHSLPHRKGTLHMFPLQLPLQQICTQVGRSDGKLVVRSGGTCVISFDGDISMCQWMTGECWTHSLKQVFLFNCLVTNLFHLLIIPQAIISLDLICMRGGVFVFGIAHSGCLAVLTLTGNDWERYSLPTDHLAWPTDYHCQHMCMSELGDGSVLVVASCSDIVGAWRLDSHNHWSVAVIGSYTVSSLCSLTLAQDVLLAATFQHQVVVQYVLSAMLQFNLIIVYAMFTVHCPPLVHALYLCHVALVSPRLILLMYCHGYWLLKLSM